MKTMLTIAALLAAAESCARTGVAREAASLSVRWADLNLTTDAGVRSLDRRIANAASTACGIPSSSDPAGKRTVKECRAEARERAQSQRQVAIALARQANATTLAAVR